MNASASQKPEEKMLLEGTVRYRSSSQVEQTGRTSSSDSPHMEGESSSAVDGPASSNEPWSTMAPGSRELINAEGSSTGDGSKLEDNAIFASEVASPLPVRRKSLWDRLCLFRKHSSGDLHSRLKTRKLLGVGETDDGEIHRSKISQLLGHNEHLYVKLPKGFSTVTRLQIAIVLIQGIVFVVVPSKASAWGLALPQLTEVSWETAMALRLVGAPLLALSYVLFNGMRVCEFYKSQAKMSLIGIAGWNGLMLLMSAWSGAATGLLLAKKTLIGLGIRLGLTALPLGYLQALYCTNVHHGGCARRSGSFSKECSSPSFLSKTPPAVMTTDQNKPSLDTFIIATPTASPEEKKNH